MATKRSTQRNQQYMLDESMQFNLNRIQLLPLHFPSIKTSNVVIEAVHFAKLAAKKFVRANQSLTKVKHNRAQSN